MNEVALPVLGAATPRPAPPPPAAPNGALSHPSFDDALARSGLRPLRAGEIEIFQINVGKLCNQTCRHCHVDAGPHRAGEQMTRETAELCLDALSRTAAHTVDLTGGAPELNRNFRYLVEGARERGRRIMDRCNLTVLMLPSQADLAEYLAEREVEIVASLPYFLADRTDAQRGGGVFDLSIAALRRLNGLGYGQGGPRVLNLVYNPTGAFLPGDQTALEREFKRELDRRFGIRFDRLFALTNMPISRFLDFLIESGNYEDYLTRLVNAFNPEAAASVMCRNTLSVGWDGRLYDCDFNQMLEMETGDGAPAHIADFDPERLSGRRIVTGRHCYGCTAGAGSSCGGATA